MACLIIKNDGIGDLILASGLIGAVGKYFHGQVDLVTCAANREIAEGIEPLRERFYVSRDGLHFSNLAARFGKILARVPVEDRPVLTEIQSRHYDVAICLRRFIRQSSLVIMRNVRATIKHCAWQFPTNASLAQAEVVSRGWNRFFPREDILSEVSYAKVFLEQVLGIPLAAQPELSFCRMQTVQPETRTVALGIGGESTNWPFGNWIELAERFESLGWKPVLFGGDNVRELAEQICRKAPLAENIVGQLSFRAAADRLESCAAFVGNDTGFSHLASLVVRNCLVILGGGTFRRFFPWPGTRSQGVVFHGMECFDCDWSCKFSDRYCLSLVHPRDVIKCLEKLLVSDHGDCMEFDLNPKNEQYEIAWRRGLGSGSSKTYVRWPEFPHY